MVEQGIGFLEAPQLSPVAVRYTVRVSLSPSGVRRIEGNVSAPDPHAFFGFVSNGGEATLVLQDGRRWECLVASSMGSLKNRSPVTPFGDVP